MKAFPHLVEMHEKYHKEGFVCLAVSTDEMEDREAALQFLKKQKATFPNYLIHDEETDWRKHFDTPGVPAKFLYGRDGKLVRSILGGEEVAHQDLEKLVEKLL